MAQDEDEATAMLALHQYMVIEIWQAGSGTDSDYQKGSSGSLSPKSASICNSGISGSSLSGSDRSPADFMEAIERDDLCAVEDFMSKGADINQRDRWQGMMALHRAACSGHLRIAEFFISRGALIDAEDYDGLKPLHWAAMKGNVEIIELLLAHNAQLDAQDKEGLTPIHWAAKKGKSEAARLLSSRKADVSKVDEDGLTPIDMAYSRGYKEIAIMISNREQKETVESGRS